MAKTYTLNVIKDEILQLMVKVLFWFSLPLALLSWSRILKVGFLPVMVLHGVLLLVLFFVFLKRKRLSQNFQAHTIILFFLAIGAGAISIRGELIYGLPGGIFAITFATILFNSKVAFRYLSLEAAIL